MTTKNITNRDKVLIDKYMETFDIVLSAETAGYSSSMANSKAYIWVTNSKNNPKPQIYAEIQRRLKKLSAKSDVSVEYVINGFKENAERCMQHEFDGTKEKVYRPAVANKALENIGRYHGIFNDKLDITVTGLGERMKLAEKKLKGRST